MDPCRAKRRRAVKPVAAAVFAGLLSLCGVASRAATPAEAQPQQAAVVRPVGTVKAIFGKTITLATDAGAAVTVEVQDNARLLRIAPGERDLKNAAPLNLQDLQVGDRILVRGSYGPDGKTVLAASVIAMKEADLASKHAQEREEWQRHGVGGLVKKVDAADGTITIATNATGAAKDVVVHVSKQTVLRRYAPDSVMFDEAKVAPMADIKEGDQLRARGTRSADGAELAADEIVSGTFGNIAGTISAIDSGAGTLTVMDLVAKKPVVIRVSKDTQLRKLAPPMAQMIAARLKGEAPGAGAGENGAPGAAARPAEGSAGAGRSGFGGAGQGRPGGARGGDFQQLLARMPAVTLADLQRGDAVMIVTTEGTQDRGATAITLLAGVEPILEASPKGGASSILTPWTMSAAPSGDTTP